MLKAIEFILLAGAVGGFINGILTESGLFLPGRLRISNEIAVWRLGIIGNTVLGSVSALILWLVYTSGNVDLVNQSSTFNVSAFIVELSVLVGMGGSRYLTVALDNTILKRSVSIAVRADITAKQHMSDASATDILRIACIWDSKMTVSDESPPTASS